MPSVCLQENSLMQRLQQRVQQRVQQRLQQRLQQMKKLLPGRQKARLLRRPLSGNVRIFWLFCAGGVCACSTVPSRRSSQAFWRRPVFRITARHFPRGRRGPPICGFCAARRMPSQRQTLRDCSSSCATSTACTARKLTTARRIRLMKTRM